MNRRTSHNTARLWRVAMTLCAALACGGAALAQTGPVPSSPGVPTPYQSPLFHSGGALTPGPVAGTYTAQKSQLQGTPSEIFNGVPTQIPSFLLGNYDPNRPPGVGGPLAYYPNHFADGSVYSWAAPFAYTPSSAGTVSVDDNAGPPTFTATGSFAQVTAGDVAATATNGEYYRLPPKTNGTATWTLTATAAGSFSVYFHIPDNIADTTTSSSPEQRSIAVQYSVITTGAFPQNVTATASQTEANATQFLAGPFQLAVGDTVTVKLTRDAAQADPILKTLNQNNTADYLIADLMTLQATVGDVQSAPAAINYDYDSGDFANAKYWGIYIPTGAQGVAGATATQNAIPDTTGGLTPSATPILQYGDKTQAQDAEHHIRQLVYFGRSEPALAFQTSVDNLSPGGYSTVTLPTTVSDTSATGGSYFLYGGAAGAGTPVGHWTLTAPANGTYFVTVHIPGNTKNPPNRIANPDNRIPDASYTISYGTPAVSKTVIISQVTPGDIALPTGAIPLLSGGTLTITLNNGTASGIATPQAVADSVTMTTGSTKGAIYCVDGFTGGVLWRFETPASLNGSSAPVFSSPAVAQIHVMVTPGHPTAPVVAPTYATKLVVIVGDNNGMVYCLDAIGNGDGTSNARVIDPATGLPITIPQPVYGTTPAAFDPANPHVGTTSVYWIYRPDPGKPKIVTGAGIGTVKTTPDPNSDLPVPAAFGSASPTILVNPAVTAVDQSDAIVFVGNSNGVLYALNPLGVPYDATANPYGDTFNAAQDLRSNTTDAIVPTCQPLWWFTLRGANPNANGSAASIESAPAVSINTTPLVFNGVTYPYHPIVYVGSAHELDSLSNVGRLYAINGLTGPSGNSGKSDPTAQPNPAATGYTGPGSANYNVAQRATINVADTEDWSFPDAYGTDAYSKGKSSNQKPRPPLGSMTGSPVVFTDTNETGTNADGTSKKTRIYIAANVGVEVPTTPAGGTVSTTASARPDDTQTGRVWAVNLDGSVGTTTNSGLPNAAGTNVWAFPAAFDPNVAAGTAGQTSPDNKAEPRGPIGSFLHMTPAVGFVQFPTNVTVATGPAYAPTDVIHGSLLGQSVPMLYVGTRGVLDTALYAVDIDGDMTATTDNRQIYRQISPDGPIFQSSPLLITNATLNGGNGGSLLIDAGNTLYDFSATPVSNFDTTSNVPLVRENKALVGFGPISSPAAAAADVRDLFTPVQTTPVETDWVYVGDSTTGLCRGIKPSDSTDGEIPPELGDIVPPNPDPVVPVDLSANIYTYLVNDANSHSTSYADRLAANSTAPLPVYEWGQNVYIRFANVAPPNPSDNPNLYVHDGTLTLAQLQAATATNPITFYSNPATVYNNGITFNLSDTTTGAYLDSGYIPYTQGTVPASATTPLPNGFFARTDATAGPNLVDSTGRGYIGAYTYAIGDGSVRLDTPGSRRSVLGASQTVSIKLFTNADGTGNITIPGNFVDPTTTLTTNILRATATSGNTVPVPIYGAGGVITGYQSQETAIPAVDQPTFGILNPIGVRGAGIPLSLNGTTLTNAVGIGDELGPFRGVFSPMASGANITDKQALINGNAVLTGPVPPSSVLTPYSASYSSTPAVVVTSTGLIAHGSGSNNDDNSSFALPPTGTSQATTTTADTYDGLSNSVSSPQVHFGSADRPFALDLFDRSALGLVNKSLRVKSGLNADAGRDGMYWNDNTPSETQVTGHDAVVNYLPWETPPALNHFETSLGINPVVNTSPDYPDISSQNVTLTLHADDNAGGSTGALNADGAVATPAATTSDLLHRTVYASPVQTHVDVLRYQPANQQLYRETIGSGYSASGEVIPASLVSGDASSTNAVFPMGYVTTRRIWIPNQYGQYVQGCAYRDIRIYTGVPVDMRMSISDGTVDIGKVPSAFGVQTSAYGTLGAFNPYNAAFQNYYLPLNINNDGNVNLMNVQLDQRISPNGTLAAVGPLPMLADPLDPLSLIPGWDINSITGAQNYLIRSSLDPDMVAAYGHLPGMVAAGYKGATFHKARPGSGSPTLLQVPDAPDTASNGFPALNPSPSGKPNTTPDTTNGNLPYESQPFVSVAVPFGTPVGTYHATVQAFEGIDISGYSNYLGNGSYNPLYPPQYGGAVVGYAAPGALMDYFALAMQPISTTGVVLKATVLEDRMTDGLTYGALPQIDAGPAGVGGSTPDLAPAAFRDPTSGALSVYWTSGRGGSFGIRGAHVSYTNPAFLAVSGGASWWNQFTPSLPAGTNSGLTITQNVFDPANVFAFVVNVNPTPYQNTLYCYPVTASSGLLSAGEAVTNDPSQVKYGIHGLNTSTAFTNNLWAFWTGSTRGRTAIYYNSTTVSNARSGSGSWPATTGVLPIPAGLTSVADPAPLLMTAPTIAAGGGFGSGSQSVIEVTYSGVAPDGTTNLYASRYAPGTTSATASQLLLVSYPTLAETLKPAAGWYQARDVAWSRTGALNISVGGAPILYDSANKPLFSKATFDKASGLLVITGVSLTGAATGGTDTVYVDLATGRVRFQTPPATTATVTATFNPLARRITDDARANTGPTTFLDTALKVNDAPALGSAQVPAYRRWYVWRKSGVSGDAHSATLYNKSQRLTVFLPTPITSGLTMTVGNGASTSLVDVDAARGRLYFPITDDGTATGKPLEGQTVTVAYTFVDSNGASHAESQSDTIQWQDELRANDISTAPTTTLAGLATVFDYAAPIDTAVNENNVSAFIDPYAGANSEHKLWLFWNSTRNGTSDLYYETIDPRF